MAKKHSLTREQVVALLDYNPDTGVFRWRDPGYARKAKGGIAGFYDKDGYRKIRILGAGVMAHHLAWFITHGRWPTVMIDHINRVPDDNRICNLREATNAQNQGNKAPSQRSATGLKGVTRIARRGGVEYRATLYIGGKTKVIGHFRCPEEAHKAYCKAALDHFGEFARFR